jgi:hypothetical protein
MQKPKRKKRGQLTAEDIIANAEVVKSIQEFKDVEPLTQSKMTRAKEEEVKQISFLSQGKQEKGSSCPTKK